MTMLAVEDIDWQKVDNLLPAVIQDAITLQVLMLGYLNRVSLQESLVSGQVTFYSRTKERLWRKGETSGNFLNIVKIIPDCDNDSILILVNPDGPTCHLGHVSCFQNEDLLGIGTLGRLQRILEHRQKEPKEGSYTTKLLTEGINRIAQKVGEEGVEVALAGVIESNDALINETVDLIYHLMVLLRARDINVGSIYAEIKARIGDKNYYT